jgi:cyclopropane fatty-acyl-phospholipid synthase-like methyltransferase
MSTIYDEIFKYSDILNPVSLQTLLSAGNLANLGPDKTLIDLGSGKGFPSLFLCSVFGVQIVGFEIGEINVDYANSRAKLLNLSSRARYFCQDLKGFVPSKKYDVVVSLGIEPEVYGGRESAFKLFRSIMNDDGVLLYTEPVWKTRPVAPQILKALCSSEGSFLTLSEMRQLMRDLKFQELSYFVSSKEDWDLYVRPAIRGLQDMLTNKKELASEARVLLEGFKMEYEAADQHWDVVMWVVKPH